MKRRHVSKLVGTLLFALFVLAANLFAAGKEHQAAVTFLPDNTLLPVLMKDLANAEKSIFCAMYVFKTDEKRNDKSIIIQDALIAAAKRGVAVTVVLDIEGKDDFVTKTNKETGREMTKAGITVRYDDTKQRMHAKLMVIDESIVFIGSHNYTYSALMRNNEATVRIVSPEIAREATTYIQDIQ